MKIKVDYTGQCILIPAGPVLDKLGDADGTKLRVLLLALANPTVEEEEMCDTLNITPKSLHNALSFWVDAGVIHLEMAATPVKKRRKCGGTCCCIPSTPGCPRGTASPLYVRGGGKLCQRPCRSGGSSGKLPAVYGKAV